MKNKKKVQTPKRAFHLARLRYITLITIVLLAFLGLSISFFSYYYTQERRTTGGNIEIHEKLTQLYLGDFTDKYCTGFNTQDMMFVIELNPDNPNDYNVVWNANKYNDYIQENINKILSTESVTTYGDYQYSKITAYDKTYIVGFYQGGTLPADNQTIRKYILLMIGIFVLLEISLYALSFIVLKPIKDEEEFQLNFIQNASHSLKTPLAVISSNIELLKEYGVEYLELENIQDEVNNLNYQVSDMLNLSTSYNKHTDVNLKEINLSNYLNAYLLSLDSLAYERELKFHSNIEDNIVVNIDWDKTRSIVANLINNAFKYTTDEKIIEASLYRQDNHVIFEIYNTGCTIHSDEKEKIFTRYYRTRESANSIQKGSGIGLSIVENYCDILGYEIKCDCKYGKYTKFILKIE